MYFQAFSSSHWSGTLWMFFFPKSIQILFGWPSLHLAPQSLTSGHLSAQHLSWFSFRLKGWWRWSRHRHRHRRHGRGHRCHGHGHWRRRCSGPRRCGGGREPAANPELLRCAKDLGQRVVYPIHPVHPVHLAVHRWNLEVSKVTPASAIGADPMLYRNGLFFLEDSIQYAIYIYIIIYILYYIIYIYLYIYIIYIYHYTSLYITIYHYISLYIIIYHYISYAFRKGWICTYFLWVEPLGLVEAARCYPLRLDGSNPNFCQCCLFQSWLNHQNIGIQQISIQEFGLTWSESCPLAVIIRNPPFHINFNHQNTMPSDWLCAFQVPRHGGISRTNFCMGIWVKTGTSLLKVNDMLFTPKLSPQNHGSKISTHFNKSIQTSEYSVRFSTLCQESHDIWLSLWPPAAAIPSQTQRPRRPRPVLEPGQRRHLPRFGTSQVGFKQ